MNDREFLLSVTLRRLHLLERAPKHTILSDLMGLQAQFAANPRICLRLRAIDYSEDTWSEGLVKIWSHRGTMYVVPEEELGMHLASLDRCGSFEDGWWGMTAEEMRTWTPFLLDAIRSGNDTRDGLKEACTAAGMSETLLHSVFYGWGGLIKELCMRGMLVGLPDRAKVYRVPEPPRIPERDAARIEFLRRYFTVFGPATMEDVRNFFGQWNAADTRRYAETLEGELQSIRIDGRTYRYIGDLGTAEPIPECVLVPGFDSLVLGYRDRGRFLDVGDRRKLVNVAGIVFPTILIRGRARAVWKWEGDTVRVTPFGRLLKKDEAAVKRTVRQRLGRKIQTVFEI